ncbi:serine--tRNA ligase, partial [Georgenia sp. 10Sc9-8]|nr:serine--tRNA ligase [Georgenia halotolerans]
MIDLRALRADPETARASQRARGTDPALVDAALEADARRRATLVTFEELRAEQKTVSKGVGKASPEERPGILARAKKLAEQVKVAQAEADAAAAESEVLARQIPNIVLDGVPAGGEDDFVVLREEGQVRDFAAEGFAPQDHLEL